VLCDLLAAELCDLCDAFPPAAADVEWHDERARARFEGRLGELPAVDVPMAELLGRLLALDLAHETQEIDHLLRNDRHRAACPSPGHVEALHLLWQVMFDQLLQRNEQLVRPFPRRKLIDVVDRFVVRFRARRAPD
jgi:hypothetical protein